MRPKSDSITTERAGRTLFQLTENTTFFSTLTFEPISSFLSLLRATKMRKYIVPTLRLIDCLLPADGKN